MKKSRQALFKTIEIILMLSILTLFTGCWDYQDINRRTIAFSFGLDKIDDNYEFSSGVARLTTTQGQSKEKSEITSEHLVISSGKSFEDARMNYENKIPFADFSGGMLVVVFGMNYAQEGIETYLNRLDNLYGIRKTALLALSRETPRELLKVEVKNDISTGFFIYNAITNLSKSGGTLSRNLGDTLKDIAMEEVGFLLPYIGREGDDIKCLGLAVMNKSKLAGILEGEDAKGVLYLLARNPQFTEAIHSPGNENISSFNIYTKKRKVETEYKDNRIIINVNVNLRADLQYEYYFKPIKKDDIKNFESMISEKIENAIKNSIQKTQKQYGCDVFQFARHFKIQHPKIYEKIAWAEEYPDAEINVTVNTKIKSRTFLDPNAKIKF